MTLAICFLAISPLMGFLAISFAAEPTSLTSSGWNQWRGPARDGTTKACPWPDEFADSLQLVWEHPHSPSYSGPVVLGGMVYTTETIDKTTEQVTAYRMKDGSKEWSVQWPGAMAVPFFAASNGDWIRSTPIVVDGSLIIFGMRDVLVCLDPETGEERWRVDFPKVMGTPLQQFGAVCSPLIDGDAVYVQTGGALVKVALPDGSIVWRSLQNKVGTTNDGAFSSPAIGTLDGTRQLIVQTREELCGVSLTDGTVLWTQPIEAFRGMNILTPLLVGNSVFTAAHSGKSQMFNIAKDENGKWEVTEKWVQKTQGYMSSPVVIDDLIYLHMKNQRLTALDAEDGTIRWTSSPFGKYWSMIVCGRRILALDQTGELLLIEANPTKLEIVDRTSVGNDTWAHLAVDGEYLIVRDLAALKVYLWKKKS